MVVNKGADGTVELEQSTELRPGTGALTGGTIGLLLGLAVGGPLGAAAVGAAGGAVAGLRDTGLSNRRLVELGEKLEAGQAALCVLIKEANWELLVERLRPLGGHLLEARLTDEAVAALEQARAQPQA